jgi:hypothetical protein
MTSNVGSRRILEASREDPFEEDDTTTATETASSQPTESSSLDATKSAIETSKSSSSPEPLRPEQVLERMQNNPDAAKLMMEASSDPDIMAAMRTAMDGSPADLMEVGKENPTVANFLERLWKVMEDDGVSTPSAPETESTKKVEPAKANGTKNPNKAKANGKKKPDSKVNGKSALDTIKDVVKDSTSGWDNPDKAVFSSGLMGKLEEMGGSGDGETKDLYSADERNNALYPRYMEVVTEALEATMKPEFLNRIDEIVVFSPLSQNDLSSIAEIIMQKTIDRAQREKEGMELLVQPRLVEKVVKDGASNAAQFGARPMRRAAQRFLEDPVSDAIVQGFLDEGDIAEIDLVHETGGSKTFGLDTIRITRRRDGETMDILVEEGSGGIGQATFKAADVKRAPTNAEDQLSSEPVRA